MTREQFNGGWLVLRGVWPKAEQSPEIYFGVLGGLPADTWTEAVKAAVLNSDYFPTPAQLLEAAYTAEKRTAEQAHTRAIEAPAVALGHPACPMIPGEHPVAYAARLAAALGLIAEEKSNV
jgi:hypothetical protein